MKKYLTLLFDLDDTLVDFQQSEHASLAQLHQDHFVAHLPITTFFQAYHTVNKDLWQHVSRQKLSAKELKQLRFKLLLEFLNITHDAELLARQYEELLVAHTQWFAGCEALLKKLHSFYKIGIITNGLTQVQENKIVRLCLNNYCQSILISETLGIAKPDRRIFDKALTELNAKAESTLMIGDSLESDYQGALNAGIDFCWINAKKTEFSQDLKPLFIIQHITELESLLLS